MKNLAQLTAARWFPTVTQPIVAGVLASGVAYALHALGVLALPSDIDNAVTPLAGFLVAAIAQKRDTTKPSAPAAPSVGETLAQVVTQELAKSIDANPAIAKQIGVTALEQLLHPVAQVAPAQAPLQIVPPPPSTPAPPSA